MKKANQSVMGTSFHGATVRATVNELKWILGIPAIEDNSGEDKTNFEWECQLQDGAVFTIYDWKEDRVLGLDEMVEWHIGAFNSFTSHEVQEQLVSLLKWNRLRNIKLDN